MSAEEKQLLEWRLHFGFDRAWLDRSDARTVIAAERAGRRVCQLLRSDVFTACASLDDRLTALGAARPRR